MAAALLLVLLLGGCGSDNGAAPPPPPDTSQVDYVASLKADQQALDRGQLLYTDLGTVDAGGDYDFEISVTDLGKGPQLVHPAPVPQGWVAPPQDVPTGGDVGMHLTCDGASCTPYDDARKPVVAQHQPVNWSFGVHLDSPGRAHIHIDAMVYRAGSDQVLSSASPIDVEISVRRTWSYTLRQTLHWVFTSATGLGLFSGGAVLTAVGGWLRRVRTARSRPDVDRVLAAIPREQHRDVALFGLLRLTNRSIREVVAIRHQDVLMNGRYMSVTFPTLSDSTYQHRVVGRRLRRAVRRQTMGRAGELIFGDGPDTATTEITKRWRRYCAGLGLTVPLAALQDGPGTPGPRPGPAWVGRLPPALWKSAAFSLVTGLIVLVAFALFPGTSTQPPAGATGPEPGTATVYCGKGDPLLGGGSTTQVGAIEMWKDAYDTACPDAAIGYGATGSGIQEFNQGKVAFAGSDFALQPADIQASKAVCAGGQAIDLPMVAGLVALVYNVDGVSHLVLDGPTAAKIFDSRITKWNDPAIAALNPGVNLPAADIQAFHQSEGSDTTYSLTSYFAKTSDGAWTAAPSTTWAGAGGQSAKDSADLTVEIKSVRNSIGYVELPYAQTNRLTSASIATSAGKPVDATAGNAATALDNSTVVGTGSDLALQLDYGTKAEDAYPIVLVTYEIACDKGNKASTLDDLKSFFNYIASEAGLQAIAATGYVPLPNGLTAKVQAAIGALS